MRQWGLKSSEDSQKVGLKGRIVENWRIIFIILMLVLMAFILRAFFAYDVAVAGGYALSGGSGAAYHVSVIQRIMETWGAVIVDPALNYPYGDLNINPPLMDMVIAVLAKIVTLFGVSANVAATGTLIWSTAILGSLTVIPVYVLAKEMFNRKAGIIAALLYVICAVAIAQSVLSNGTEAAFYGFFFAIMLVYLHRAIKSIGTEPTEWKKGGMKSYMGSIFGGQNRTAFKYALIAGFFLIIVELSWNGFRPIVIMLGAMMVIQAIIDRVRGKDASPGVMVYATVLTLSTIVCSLVYISVDLWGLIYSGSFLIAVVTVISALIISETKKKPWIMVIPLLIIGVIIFMVLLSFISPSMFGKFVDGNSVYLDPTYASLVAMNSGISLSAMAASYGWFTMWLPYILIALMVFKLKEQFTSSDKSFIMLWMVATMLLSWSSDGFYLAAVAYVVGAGAMIALIFKRADIPGYVAGFKGIGLHFRSILKAIFKPLPFMTILMAVFLVAAPNASYAIDAATSSNSGENSDGAFGYYAKDSDWDLNDLWDAYADEDKDGAMVTWWDYAAEAQAKGGFDSVAGLSGSGASAVSNILLSEAGAESNAAMAIRLIEYYGIENLRTYLIDTLGFTTEDYDTLERMINDPSNYKSTILSNPDVYGKYSTDISDENAMYIAATTFLTADLENRDIPVLDRNGDGALSETETIELYEYVANKSKSSISYILVTLSMIPLMYGDGSSFSTLAYMNNYYLDGNGSPTEFYTLAYTGYYTYTDAMFETLLWKAYFGGTPSDFGYSSAVSMLNAFAASDGSENTRPQPGYNLVNYEVTYWQVLYNEDSEATEDSDGWEQMDAFLAMEKQDAKIANDEDPGLINFMSGLPILLEYVPTSSSDKVSGTVTSAGDNVEGVRVTLFDGKGIQRSTTFTDEYGKYEMYVPSTERFENGWIEITVGTTSASSGGFMVESIDLASASEGMTTEVGSMEFVGKIYFDDSLETQYMPDELTITVTGAAHGMNEKAVYDGSGTFTIDSLIPDTYTITVTDDQNVVVSTTTINPIRGTDEPVNVNLFLTTGTLNLTLTDENGNAFSSEDTDDAEGKKWYAEVTSTNTLVGGYTRTMIEIVDGKATVSVIPGTYTVKLVDMDEDSTTNYEFFGNIVAIASGGSGTITAAAGTYATFSIKGLADDVMTVSITNGTYSTSCVILPGSSEEIKVPAGIVPIKYSVSGSYVDSDGKTQMGSQSIETKAEQKLLLTVVQFHEAFEYSRTIMSTSGSAVTGTVMMYSSTGEIYTGWANNGKLNMLLPADDYLMYAYSSSEAFIGDVSIVGASRGGTIQLESSKTLTINVLSSTSGTNRIPYVPVTIYSEKGEFTVYTNTSGQYTNPVPRGDYTFSMDKYLPNSTDPQYIIEGDAVGGKVTKGGSQETSAITVTFRTTSPAMFNGNIIIQDQFGDILPNGLEITFELDATNSVPVTFIVNPDELDTEEGKVNFDGYLLILGTYDVTIDKTTGYYYDGTVTLSASGDATITVKKVDIVTFTMDETDRVTVTANDDEAGWYGSDDYDDEEGQQTYYFEIGKQFTVQIRNSVTDARDNGAKVFYYFMENGTSDHLTDVPDEIGISVEVDLQESFELKGFAGFNGTGFITIEKTDDASVTDPTYYTFAIIVVSSGTYSTELPLLGDDEGYRFNSYIGAYDEDEDKYEYEGKREMSADWDTEKGVFNIGVIGAPFEDDGSTDTPDLTVTISNGESTGKEREVKFEVTINGPTNFFRSLFLSGNSNWESIKFYSDSARNNEISYINLNDLSGNATVYVTAVYAEDIALDTGLELQIKDALGTSIQSETVDLSDDTIFTGITIEYGLEIGRGESDNYGEHEYAFTILVKNTGNTAQKFTVTYTGADIADDWFWMFTDSTGKTLYAGTDSPEFTVPGMSELTVLVKLINLNADSLPTFDIKVTADDVPADKITADEENGGSKASDADQFVTVTIEPTGTSIKGGDGNASGPNIFMDGGSIPMYIWAMVALAILMFIFILWLGMRRGVFTRRK